MKNKQQGFTLLELMVVTAIIGILASIAFPFYQEYVTKAQFNSALAEITPGKRHMEILLNENVTIQLTSAAELSIKNPTKNCSSVLVSAPRAGDGQGSGEVKCIMTGTSNVNGKYISWIRETSGGWTCDTDVDAKFSGKCN